MSAPAAPATSLATKPFILLCAAMFLGYASQWVMTPVIPLYVKDLGGSAFVAGLVLLAFAVPSFTIRPFVGHLADTWSRAGVFMVGLAILSVGSLLCLVPFIAMLFIGNIARGAGWAGMNVGGYTMLATAAPASRRGEASGYYTGVMTSVHIVFPAVGLWLIAAQGASAVFLLSALLALAGIPVMAVLARLVRSEAKAAAQDTAPASAGFLDRGVLIATGINLCSTLVSPSIMAFLPLYARELGIANIGWFYVVAGVTSIFVRPLLGKKSDAMGRGPALAMGLASQLLGFVLIVAASDIEVILVGGFFVSVGMAMISSISTALALDLSDPRSRGRSMATFSMSFQVGAGLGAVIAGAIADLVSLRGMYVGSVVITVAGFAILASAWKSLPRPSKDVTPA
jgi:MFS family permease